MSDAAQGNQQTPSTTTTHAEIDAAAREASTVLNRRDHVKARIDELEESIRERQERIATETRALNAHLYDELAVLNAEMAAREEALKQMALAIWRSLGSPERGKTFGLGSVQVKVHINVAHYDEGAALIYCDEHFPNAIKRVVDKQRLVAAMKVEALPEVPTHVCVLEPVAAAVVLEPRLKKVDGDNTDGSPTPLESANAS